MSGIPENIKDEKPDVAWALGVAAGIGFGRKQALDAAIEAMRQTAVPLSDDSLVTYNKLMSKVESLLDLYERKA